jgi:hypothetical protein
MAIRASVVAGRRVDDQDASLDLDAVGRTALDDALAEALDQVARGETRDASEVIRELRAKR